MQYSKRLLIFVLTTILGLQFAYAIPNLKKQGSWDKREKKAFLNFLDSGKNIPIKGQVKSVQENLPASYSSSKASYLNFNIIGESLFTRGRDGVRRTTSSDLGGRFLYGNHLFSWVRSHTGLQYSLVTQTKKRRVAC